MSFKVTCNEYSGGKNYCNLSFKVSKKKPFTSLQLFHSANVNTQNERMNERMICTRMAYQFIQLKLSSELLRAYPILQ